MDKEALLVWGLAEGTADQAHGVSADPLCVLKINFFFIFISPRKQKGRSILLWSFCIFDEVHVISMVFTLCFGNLLRAYMGTPPPSKSVFRCKNYGSLLKIDTEKAGQNYSTSLSSHMKISVLTVP